MEKIIINKEILSDMFAKNEIEAAELLRDSLMDVKKTTGGITDIDIKNYNAMTTTFMLNISLTTIKKYAAKYGYGIFNVSGSACVVKQFMVDDYSNIKTILDKESENKGDNIMDNKKSTQEILAVSFVTRDFNNQSLMSIRCSVNEQARLESLAKSYPMLTKQFLLSLVLSHGMDSLGFFPKSKNENING